MVRPQLLVKSWPPGFVLINRLINCPNNFITDSYSAKTQQQIAKVMSRLKNVLIAAKRPCKLWLISIKAVSLNVNRLNSLLYFPIYSFLKSNLVIKYIHSSLCYFNLFWRIDFELTYNSLSINIVEWNIFWRAIFYFLHIRYSFFGIFWLIFV